MDTKKWAYLWKRGAIQEGATDAWGAVSPNFPPGAATGWDIVVNIPTYLA